MGQNTKIEWADHTWNPVTGCTKVSPGCDHCYIDRTETCAVLRRIWTDPKDREVVDAVEVLLEQRADEVRNG